MVICAVVLAACGAGQEPRSTPAAPRDMATAQRDQRESSSPSASRGPLEHSCTGKGIGPFDAEGQYPPKGDWRQRGVVVGDVGFPDYEIFRDRATDEFTSEGNQYWAHAFAVIVAAAESATIRVTRGEAAFLVGLGASDGDGRYAFSDGVDTLELDACDEQDTRFLEAMIVAGPQCVGLWVNNRDGTESVVDMPFGTSCD